jgi:hypothetical protein
MTQNNSDTVSLLLIACFASFAEFSLKLGEREV